MRDTNSKGTKMAARTAAADKKKPGSSKMFIVRPIILLQPLAPSGLRLLKASLQWYGNPSLCQLLRKVGRALSNGEVYRLVFFVWHI